MPKFRYKAIDETGNVVEREAVYPSEEVLLGELARSGLSLVRIERIDKEEKEKKSIDKASLWWGREGPRHLHFLQTAWHNDQRRS
jgi:type II secretory pathway component PulF